MSSWSGRNTTGAGAKGYAIIKGKAYPDVLRGANPTRVVKAPHLPHVSAAAREAFYHDPAVKLSDADLDDINGAEGAPLCVEHNRGDVVGKVHHAWLDEADGSGRCLKITGRIPLDTERGRRIVADIRCGKYKGFSVGYSADLKAGGGGAGLLRSKAFNEISLVAEPFFDGCDLTVGVVASKDSPAVGQGKLGNN